MEDAELLARYADSGDQAAFAELVRRHLGLVHAAAWRRAGGDAHRAEEIASQVFVLCARRARELRDHPVLPAWLHRCTAHVASALHRAEARRRRHEQAAAREAEWLRGEAAPDWAALAPELDAALDALAEKERAAVLLRFFAGESYGEVGRRLGLSENAARMRTDRALEKLRAALARRGVRSGAALLGAALARHAVAAPPAGLAERIAAQAGAAGAAAGAAAAGAAAGAGNGLFFLMTKTQKLGLVAALVILAAGASWWIGGRDGAGAGTEVRGVSPPSKPSGKLESRSHTEAGSHAHTPATRAAALLLATPRFETEAALDAAILEVLKEPDVERQRALLAKMGVTISHEALGNKGTAWRGWRWGTNTGFSLAHLSHNARGIFSQILGAWAGEQPAAAVAWFLAQPGYDGSRESESVEMLASVLLRGTDEPLVAALLAAAPRPGNATALRTMRRALGDPEGFVRGAGGRNPRDPNLENALAALARQDPRRAVAAAVGAGDPAILQSALSILAQQRDGRAKLSELAADPAWEGKPGLVNLLLAMGGDATADFAAARAQLGEDLDRNFSFLLDIGWAKTDPAAALANVLARTSGDWRGGLYLMLRDGTGPKVAEQDFARWIAAAAPERQNEAWTTYYSVRGFHDAAGALAALQANGALSAEMRTTSLERVLGNWAGRDASAALEWMAANLVEPSARGAALNVVAQEMAQHDPEGALMLVQSAGVAIEPRLAARLAEAVVLEKGLPGLPGFLAKVADPAVHDVALAVGAIRGFSGDWSKVVAYIDQHARADQLAAKLTALSRWPDANSRENLLVATNAFSGLAEAGLHARGAGDVARVLANRLTWGDSVVGALEWSNSLPGGLAVGARLGVVEAATDDQAPASLRREAREFIKRAALPEEERKRLLARLGE